MSAVQTRHGGGLTPDVPAPDTARLIRPHGGEPRVAELVLDTDEHEPEQSAQLVVETLQQLGLVRAAVAA